MKVPTPCLLGQKSICKKKELVFSGFSWFKWSWGIDYTYFFHTGNKWSEYTSYNSNGINYNTFYTIDSSLLEDKPLREHGYPLKGNGYLFGIFLKNYKLYADLILTSKYLTHLKVECTEHGHFLKDGNIIYPPTPMWETEEKRKDILVNYPLLSHK